MNQVQQAGDQSTGRHSPGPRLFVWLVWTAMLAVVLWHFSHYARNLPLAEDWNLVAPLTGNEPDLGGWLWSQNNEHRVPLPRLVMLVLLEATGGDFRGGMILNIALIALLAAAMMEVARRLRGGRTRYTDAFFPILLLQVGDWQNLFWSWQISFVLSVVIICAALGAIVLRPSLDSPGTAAATGVALVLAPLTGGTGLLFLPPLMLWAGWRGWRLARAGASPSQRLAGFILIGAVVLTVAIIGIYLIGYRRPDWVPDNPGLGRSLITAVQFQTFGLGPAVRTAWNFWSAVALLLLAGATARVILTILRPPVGTGAGIRLRAWGLLVGLVSAAGFAGGMGWGRAAVINVYNGWPDRYVLLAALAFCLAYFAWELPGREREGRLARGVLFGAVILLLPLNTAFGREYGRWYVTGMDRLIRDIQSGIHRDDLASRHQAFLIHWWDPPELAEHMQMLHDDGIGPLATMNVTEDSVLPAQLDTLTVRYRTAEAGAVNLIWWTGAGYRVPPSLRPPGSKFGKQGFAVNSPMRREGDVFTVTLQIPRGMSVEYGFQVIARNDLDSISGVWDGGRRYEAGAATGQIVVEAEPRITLLTNPLGADDTTFIHQTVHYGPTDARRVRILWGIDGWQRLPDSLYPPRTRTVSQLMSTSMQREGTMFTATLPVPERHRLDFSFQVDRGDRVGISDNNRGENYSLQAVADSALVIKPQLTRPAGSRLTTVLSTGLPALLLVAVLGALSEGVGRRVNRAAR
jgi:hypothetical protein